MLSIKTLIVPARYFGQEFQDLYELSPYQGSLNVVTNYMSSLLYILFYIPQSQTAILISFLGYVPTGSAYFILGVRINNFKGKTHEFEKAAQDFIKGIGDVNAAPPLYKIYPTKPYKEFVKSFARMHAIGRYFYSAQLCSVYMQT